MFELFVYILLFFIGASLILYVVLGGADYGAGILELLPSKPFAEKQKHVVNHAMGPVWEANHMWLIIVIVILFMGFPKAFNAIMVALHLPMVALLVGIVIRGCAFTFRHYDAVQAPASQKIYTWLFGLSSVWTSYWLGVIAASLFRAKINMQSLDVVEAYVLPWWGLFPAAMGLFVIFIFAFLAGIYLVGETEDVDLKKFFARRAYVFNVLVVLGGGLVFLTSSLEGGSLFEHFVSHPLSIVCMILATALFGLLWFRIEKRKSWRTRTVAAAQVSFILLGWFSLHWPHVLYSTSGPLSFFEAAAPESTLFQLVLALLVGSLFIFPSLFYLIHVFKQAEADQASNHSKSSP